MRDRLTLILAFAALLASMPLLSACYTMQGAGQDLQAGGKTLEKSADRNTTYRP